MTKYKTNRLTPTQRKMLDHFARNIDRAISYDEWMEVIGWCSKKNIQIHVQRLRLKIPNIQIYSVYGVGYIYERER